VLKATPVVDREESYDAGWLAGLYDGEGHLTAGPGWRVTLSQKPGPVLDRAVSLLRERGYDLRIAGRSNDDVAAVTINGGMQEVWRFFMQIRPGRLLAKLLTKLPEASLYGRSHQAVSVVAKEFLGEQEVVAIQTGCSTFIAEGLASHNCYISNFYRALQTDPEAVAHWADWPVNEADLHARHRWLLDRSAFRQRMRTDPDYYDAKVAGWWVWGISQWIGGGWCGEQWYGEEAEEGQRASQQLPHLGNAGRGVHAQRAWQKRPHLGNAGRGVHAQRAWQQRPHLGDAGTGVHAQRAGGDLSVYFATLAARLRRVRVCCGDWTRVLGPAPTTKLGLTAILLDPPYSHAERAADIYAVERDIAADVRAWAVAHGDTPMLRIALCSYGEESCPSGWEAVPWKANGGYGSQSDAGRGRENAKREVVWFSPHCLRPDTGQRRLF
jgi:hypothetical protein